MSRGAFVSNVVSENPLQKVNMFVDLEVAPTVDNGVVKRVGSGDKQPDGVDHSNNSDISGISKVNEEQVRAEGRIKTFGAELSEHEKRLITREKDIILTPEEVSGIKKDLGAIARPIREASEIWNHGLTASARNRLEKMGFDFPRFARLVARSSWLRDTRNSYLDGSQS